MTHENLIDKLLNLQKEQAKELSLQEQQFHHADFVMLQHIIDYAKMGVKALFLLNGTAAVSVLTLFTSTSLSLQNIYKPLLNSVEYFSWGAICAIMCILLAYFSQIFYQNECASMGNQKILRIQQKHLSEEELFILDERKHYTEDSMYINNRISNIESSLNEIDSSFLLEQKKEKRFGYLGNTFTVLCILIVFLSLFFFVKGVSGIKNSFINSQSVTIKQDVNIAKDSSKT